ncbi:hypothetical protein BKA67DRAFT_536691 [Truncatella angustata]|uniref:Uncharacterized protein n=1 Tax=Truncatella angustata TaxID=152316 RepID=A0A9P8UIH7_9PEZI|nr:uncharacterized protein BKA67DRAFT_536691 [Truncatella angustata]KAH6652988.1 hypothetical protein BKA67DRAFT_536691 [Truncatella angustata]
MGKEKKKGSSVRLAESVALLSILDQVPGAALLHAVPKRPNDTDGRSLSIEQEVEICTSLSFIAGISDEACDVMAVAVEERQDPRRIHIKVAINKSISSDGEEILQKVIEGFKGIFGSLTKVANDDSNIKSSQILCDIIDVSRDRILKRLRSAKIKSSSRQTGKPTLLAMLKTFIVAVESDKQNALFQQCSHHAKQLVAKLEAVEETAPGIKEKKCLRRLIDAVGRFLDLIDMKQVLLQLKNQHTKLLDPNTGDAILDRLKKIAHYHSVAICLFEYAKIKEVFKSSQVEAISQLPGLIPANHVSTDLAYALNSISLPYDAQNTLVQKIKIQKKAYRNYDPTEKFSETVKRTLSSGKVHAEVQLMFHYEMTQPSLRPRTIVSTKSACFLCNTLFRLHGKYHIPSTHGKLYPGWLLPSNAGQLSTTLTEQLNTVVQGYNRRIAEKLLSNTQRARFYSGNESIVYELAVRLPALAGSVISTVASSIRQASRLSAYPRSSTSIETIRPFGANRNESNVTRVPEISREPISGLESLPRQSQQIVILSAHHPSSIISQSSTVGGTPIGCDESILAREEGIAERPVLLESWKGEKMPGGFSVPADQQDDDPSCVRNPSDATGAQQSGSTTPSIFSGQHVSGTTSLTQGGKRSFTLYPDAGPTHVQIESLALSLDYPGKADTNVKSSKAAVVAEVEWLPDVTLHPPR